jgi:hypothetical protein
MVRRSERKTLLSEVLPGGIVAKVNALGPALVQVARAHRYDTLATLEKETLTTIRAAMAGLLGAVLALSTTSVQPGALGRTVPCPTCAGRTPVDGWRPRTIQTVCGPLSVERPWYHCRTCRHGWSPTDTTWELAPRARISAGLADWLIDLGASTSFADARRELAKLSGLKVSAETIRQYPEQRGTQMETADQAAAESVLRTQETAQPLNPAPGTLVVETDGVMVRYQSGGHEVKLGLVGGQVQGELTAMSYLALRQSAELFGPRLLAEAARRGALEIVGWESPITGSPLAHLRRVVVLGDGALGLPLGSGAVESAGKHVVQLRMKRAGTRWSDDRAQAVLTVRCRLISHRSLAA